MMDKMIIEELYLLYIECRSVSTDTRDIAPGSIFFALKGERFNANTFADEALAAGAQYVVIDEEQYKKNKQYIVVEDVLQTLQGLAHYHRKQLHMPFIGITGTNGKTTTKELLYAVLSQKFRVLATKGNLNNHIGVPLTLLSINADIEIAIIEMGANHPEEIAFLCSLAEPTHGLITNVGKAHLEGFGSFEGVKKTKGELYDFLQAHEGVLFLQSDNPHLVEMEAMRGVNKVVRYGFSTTNDIIGKLETANPFLTVSWHKQGGTSHEVLTHLTGFYNTENILAAVATGDYFGLSAQEINAGIAGYIPTNNRSQIIKTANNTVIADYYNANASSMAAALDNVEVIEGDRKVIILGDMFEMGGESAEEHRKLITKAQSMEVDKVIFVGKAFYAARNDKAVFFESTDDAKELLTKQPIKDSLVLLKASRGMAFEQLMELL